MTSPRKHPAFGTVGTVYPICNARTRAHDNERARGSDFPENASNCPKLSQLAPEQREFDLTPERPFQWYDVFHAPFPLGIRDRIGRIQARTLREAEQLAREQFGDRELVVSLARRRPTRRAS